MSPRRPDSGLTLVEVLVALVIFALIGITGFGMLDQVLRVQNRTEGRLDRLAAMQRTLYLISADFAAALPGSVVLVSADDGPSVELRRSAPDAALGSVALRYATEAGNLTRTVSDPDGTVRASQRLLDGIARTSWRLFDPKAGWAGEWPPAGSLPTRLPQNPAAVEVRLTLADGTSLRRVAPLPAEPR